MTDVFVVDQDDIHNNHFFHLQSVFKDKIDSGSSDSLVNWLDEVVGEELAENQHLTTEKLRIDDHRHEDDGSRIRMVGEVVPDHHHQNLISGSFQMANTSGSFCSLSTTSGRGQSILRSAGLKTFYQTPQICLGMR